MQIEVSENVAARAAAIIANYARPLSTHVAGSLSLLAEDTLRGSCFACWREKKSLGMAFRASSERTHRRRGFTPTATSLTSWRR